MQSTATPLPEVTDKALDIVRHALTLSRNERIESIPALRLRLCQEYPDAEADIQAALVVWARQSESNRGFH